LEETENKKKKKKKEKGKKERPGQQSGREDGHYTAKGGENGGDHYHFGTRHHFDTATKFDITDAQRKMEFNKGFSKQSISDSSCV